MNMISDLADAAKHLLEDLKMLRDGQWAPDKHSAQASIDNAEMLTKGLTALSCDGIYIGDNRYRNTILAALRYYQQKGMGEPSNRSDDIHDIATNGDNDISMDAAGIDELCEKINIMSKFSSQLVAAKKRSTRP